MNKKPLKNIGRNVLRFGARERLTGQALFAADFRMEDVVTLKVLRSDRPHASIVEIDVSAALQVPGCVGVFTSKDIPGTNRLGIINKDQRLLADDKVRFVGDPVALVAAETQEAADKALEAVKVVYQDLPAVYDPEEALRPAAPIIHEKSNLLGRRVITRGNVEAAFERAHVIVEREYKTPFIEHTYLEPDAGQAYPDADGTIVVHACTQNPHYDQKDVATLLGVDEDRVRIIQAATGGGFGSKLDLNAQGFLGLAVHLLKRPARLVYSREEAYLCTAKRHPIKMYYKTAADKEGRLLATDVRMICDTGAYASYGLAVLSRAAVHAPGPYEVPNVRIEAVIAYTNHPMAGAMRGFGVPQAAFAHETQMDLLAEALGMTPVEIRRKNCYRIGALTATGQELKASVGIGATLDAVAPYYLEERDKLTESMKPYVRRGRGIACMMYGIGNTGMQNPSTARVELHLDGSVTLFTGAADIGQGSTTVLAQIAAEQLGLNAEDIRTVVADTLYTTSAGATSASRQTYISGNAVCDAVTKLKGLLLTEGALILKTDRSGLILENGFVRSRTDPSLSVSFERIARRARKTGMPLQWQGYFDPDTTPLNAENGQGVPYATYAFAAHVADVEVDLFTGEVKVLRVVAAHDVGKAVNPRNVEGQIYSGVAMGMGYGIMEEYEPGKTESMKDYHIPTCSDMPEVIPLIVEDPEPTGPYGAKGVGEPALIPTAPAILNALAEALGVRIYELPANLERVMKAISLRSEGKGERKSG